MSRQTDTLIETLHEYRPTDSDIAEQWPLSNRDELLERIVAFDSSSLHSDAKASRAPRRHRRKVLSSSVLFAACAVGIGAMATVPRTAHTPDASHVGGSSAPVTAPVALVAKTLPELMHIAASLPTDNIGPGQYLHHVVRRSLSFAQDKKPGENVTEESWTSYSGYVWTKGTSDGQPVQYYGRKLSGGIEEPTPASVGELPTDPAQLENALRAAIRKLRQQWPDDLRSEDDELFDKLAALFDLDTLPPGVRAAGIKVLSALPGVRVDSNAVDSLGRHALAVSGALVVGRGVKNGQEQKFTVDQTVWFDPATSAFLESRTGGGSFVADVKTGLAATVAASSVVAVSTDVVDAIPSEVVTGVEAWVRSPDSSPSLSQVARKSWPQPKVG